VIIEAKKSHKRQHRMSVTWLSLSEKNIPVPGEQENKFNFPLFYISPRTPPIHTHIEGIENGFSPFSPPTHRPDYKSALENALTDTQE
jgi:hypothetical protein